VRMGDIEYRAGTQFRLTVADELAHRGVGAEEMPAFAIDFDLAHAADIEHRTKRRFALAQCCFGAFEAGDIGASHDEADNFAFSPLRLETAMDRSSLAGQVRRINVELDGLSGEALAHVRLDGREGFVSDHLRESFADHLLRRKIAPLCEPLRMVP